MQKKRFRQRANRYGFTVNNPFITPGIRVLDVDNLSDEQRRLLGKVKHDYSALKDYPELFDFALVEYEQKDGDCIIGKIVAERAFFKNYAAAQEYFMLIDFIDYFCFQYEQGKAGNLHLQGFMHFSRPMDFEVVRAIFPTMHLQKCEKNNSECRAYCMKNDATKIDGYDFFESGVIPADERQRTDMPRFKKGILSKTPVVELFNEFPMQTLHNINKIIQIRQLVLNEEFSNKTREIHVTYIYGAPDAGKTTFINRVLGYSHIEVGRMSDYKSGRFDDYENQDILLFDEFYGQLSIPTMNDLLNEQPRHLPARYVNRVACYTKVFITSNYALDEQYRKQRAAGQEPSFGGFLRRITEIIYMPARNVHIWQKGVPTEKVKQALAAQGATYSIEPDERYTAEALAARVLPHGSILSDEGKKLLKGEQERWS